MTTNHHYLCAQELTIVQLAGRSLIDQAEDCISALVASNAPPTLFIHNDVPVWLNQADGTQRKVNGVNMKLALSSIAVFTRHDKQQHPPDDLVKAVLELLPDCGLFPQLHSVVHAPTLRPDGSIIDVPGFDETCGIFYAPEARLQLPQIPAKPTPQRIKEAVHTVEDVIHDFPFVDEASRANAFAAMLTPVLRPAIIGSTLMAVFDAPDKGTGKSLLADVVSIVATGSEANMITAPTSEAEWRKTITSVLLSERPITFFDNVGKRVSSDALCSALSSQTVSDRLLGASVQVNPRVRCCWICTANNVQFEGQIARRVYWIRMDAKTPQPFKRTGFKYPLLREHVKAERGNLLAALMTMARAWFAADCPKPQVTPVGGFEEWTNVIGGILEVCGVRGFLANDNVLYEQSDLETQNWLAFLTGLNQRAGKNVFTMKEIVVWMKEHDDFADAVQTLLGNAANDESRLKQLLPRRLKEKLGRRFGDENSQVWIEDAGTIQHARRWIVRTERKNVIEMHKAKKMDEDLSDEEVLAQFQRLAQA